MSPVRDALIGAHHHHPSFFDALVAALAKVDLGDFLGTFIATLTGAAVAASVSFAILRTQRRDRYREGLVSALRGCITAVLTFSSAAVNDPAEDDRKRMGAQAELMLLTATAKGEDAWLANLIATEFDYLSARQNAARSRLTADLASHLSAMANTEIPRLLIAEGVHETAANFRPHAQAPDLPPE